MAKRSKAWGTRRIYEFIKAHRHEHDIQTMCSALEVTRSGQTMRPHFVLLSVSIVLGTNKSQAI
jgi:hypothetical protein